MCLCFHYASHKSPPGFVCVCVCAFYVHPCHFAFLCGRFSCRHNALTFILNHFHFGWSCSEGEANVDAPRLALPAPRLSVSVKLL